MPKDRMLISQQLITVHFSPEIIKKIGTGDTKGWASAFRDWHHNGDPEKNFGRNVPNSRGSENTWAWHLHMAPDEAKDLALWDKAKKAYDRTSDRLIVYSLANDQPLTHGILLLAFLSPKGHQLLTQGASALERQARWEDIAYTHQIRGTVPPGTITEA